MSATETSPEGMLAALQRNWDWILQAQATVAAAAVIVVDVTAGD